MGRGLAALALVCLLAPQVSAAEQVLTPTWDGIYEYRGPVPRETHWWDNVTFTSLHLAIYKQYSSEQGTYDEDVAMIAFDLREIPNFSEAKLVLVREDGDLVRPLVVNVFVVEDDGVGTREDFFAPGTFVGTISIAPRPNGIALQEESIDFTDAVRLAKNSNMEFAAFRLEFAGDWGTGAWQDTHYVHSSEYGMFVTPRLEFVRPDPGTLLQLLFEKVSGVGSGKSLANKVTLAQTYYAVPDVQATCAVLVDFVDQVEALAGKRKLSATLASDLTADAQVIMTAIGCE